VREHRRRAVALVSVLVDRGLDIDHAFHKQHSLAPSSPAAASPSPRRAYDRGIDWLASFPRLLTT
jgi:hypothetical protein